jgi:hypothetical protein
LMVFGLAAKMVAPTAANLVDKTVAKWVGWMAV